MGKGNKPLLSISLLASNRPDTIRRCLDSLKPIMDRLPSELILVDTSGSQEIHGILLEYTQNVVDFQWCDDFAKARNSGLQRAKGEWFLFLDDDEWFVDYEPLVHFFESGECKQYGCANYLVRNFYDVNYTQYTDTWVSRVIRRYDDTHFESKIHEYLVPVRGECQNIPARAYHSGYVYATAEEREKHFRRNATLLEKMIEEEPDRLRWRVQLVQEYRAAGHKRQVYNMCMDYLNTFADVSQEFDRMDLGTFYGGAADCMNRACEYQKSIEIANRGLADSRMNELCSAYLYLQKAYAHSRLLEWKSAEECVCQYMEKRNLLAANPRRLERQKSSLIVSEAFEPDNVKKAERILEQCNRKKACLLTISMLISGREDTTLRALESIQPLMQAINCELILINTGCGEELLRRVSAYSQDILPFSWCDDFAKARNVGIEKASGKWFMYLDDDEWFEDVSPIIQFFETGEYEEYQQAVYRVRNYLDPQGTSYLDGWASRMIELAEDTHFEGRVHEALVPALGSCRRLDALAHHVGYAFATAEEKKTHAERNISILEELLREEPNNIRWPLHLLKEYISMEMWEKVSEVASGAICTIEECGEPFINQCRASFYTASLLAKMKLKEYEKLHALFVEYIADERLDMAGLCSVLRYEIEGTYEEGLSEQGTFDWDGIRKKSETYLECWHACQTQQLSEQEQIILESLVLVNQAIEDGCYRKIRDIWLLANGHLGCEQSVWTLYADEAADELRKWMEGNGDFLSFEEVKWELGAMRILPLEKIILELPFSQWMALVYSLNRANDLLQWIYIKEQLDHIRTKDDLRYDYFYMNFYNQVITQNCLESAYDQEEQLLADFCAWNLQYARKVYTKEAIAGQEQLPEHCQGAIWLDRSLHCAEDAWEQRLEYLKQGVNAWPSLADFVKLYAKHLGERREAQLEADACVNEELRNMATEVLKQVEVLVESEKHVEALAIVNQLLQMLPKDEELLWLKSELENVIN